MNPRAAYALAALAIFAIEVIIALFVRDHFVRPYLGDVLAVALVYLVFRASGFSRRISAILTLLIATAIEMTQAFDLLGATGLGDNAIARIVLGGAFDPVDFACYAAGLLLVICIETAVKAARRKRARP
jgi:hypothetical protein